MVLLKDSFSQRYLEILGYSYGPRRVRFMIKKCRKKSCDTATLSRDMCAWGANGIYFTNNLIGGFLPNPLFLYFSPKMSGRYTVILSHL